MRFTLTALALGAALLGGCASGRLPSGYPEKLAFTDSLAAEYKVANGQKRLLQYYVSDTIRLVRSASGGQTGIRDGRLVSSSSRAIDQVIVDGGTPGVVLASGPHWMAVSFEEGSYLYFVSEAPREVWLGDEYVNDRYYLYIPNWNGTDGSVRLGNDFYTAVDDSYRAHLVVDRETFDNVSERAARLPGRVLVPR